MRKVLLVLILILFISSPVLAVNKYPSEQMINRCFPIGTTYWQAKLNMAQISLDYQLETIYYEKNLIRFRMLFDEDKVVDVEFYFNSDKKLWGIDYLKMYRYNHRDYIDNNSKW